MRDRGPNGDLPLDLFRLEVKRRVPRVGPSQPVDGPARVEHCLGQAGLAIVAVPEQRDVADPFRVESGHRFSLSRESVNPNNIPPPGGRAGWLALVDWCQWDDLDRLSGVHLSCPLRDDDEAIGI